MSAPVLITGAAKRIGLFIARSLREQGVEVIGTYRRQQPALGELEAMGVQLYHCDFCESDHVHRLIDSLQRYHPALRGIIHNASDWIAEGQSELSPEQVMERMMRVHAYAPYQLNLALAPLLRNCPDSVADIIHITDFAVDKGSKHHIAYSASKAASENLSRSFARLLAPQVKVNSIAPSLILFNEGDSDDYREHTLAKALLPREPGEAEVLHAVTYLMESRYVTGRTLHLDGGRHLK
ncbi:dihydromonapterin reductase [Aestuariirhabdus litorea]|uniref:Dihydromonapterin reductase n=1 Tax=Aestuariirhabdus litorea TaxID=2528527 RepID=A0A3P3VM50_9GAMM|nr:dihydromonapterin reductase [Aestuariirhabdus litorea]RRJ83842.1 dihydromonapterin reductase [Aestuariirhabdus litorea]RWW97065.1 dihydromonapterin reductase [Endozoicomonadaceae bacterium GTF-13]